MSHPGKPLRLIRGGRDELRFGRLLVTPAPPDAPPFPVDVVVAEEDTWRILDAEQEVRPPAEHPLRLLNDLMTAVPLLPGTVTVVGEKMPLKLLAIVYDVGEDPCTRPEWVAAVLAETFAIAARQGGAAMSLPLLGMRYGRFPLADFIRLLTGLLREAGERRLRKLWLVVPPEMMSDVRRLLVASLMGEWSEVSR